MKVAIDRAGRLVLPKTVRDQLGVGAGDELELHPTPDGVELRPARQQSRLRQVGGVLVFHADPPANPQTLIDVVRRQREERSRKVAAI